MKVGFIGLGKMGLQVSNNIASEHQVFGYDKNKITQSKVRLCDSLKMLVHEVGKNGVYWIMINHEFIDELINELSDVVCKDSILVDCGNSSYGSSLVNCQKLKKKNIHFITIGMSGGIKGALKNPPMMVDGDPSQILRIRPLLKTLGGNFTSFSKTGKAHLAKTLHNAIEYGMMQSIAEGVSLYLKHGYSQNEILKIFNIWKSGSIIESKLINLTCEILNEHDLNDRVKIKKSETLDLVKNILISEVNTPVIESAIHVRKNLNSVDSVTITVLALLRNKFGGHETFQ